MDLFEIEQLLTQHKLKEAHKAILLLLQTQPDNKDAQKLKSEIEAQINELNNNSINAELPKLAELISNNNPAEALKLGLKLKEFAPNHPELLELINKAHKAYDQNQSQNQNQAYTEFQAQIKALTDKNNFQAAIKLTEEAFKKNNDPALQQLNLELREQLVNYKLEANKASMDLIPVEKVLKFLEELSKIAPNHAEVANLKRRYQTKLNKDEIVNRKNYLTNAVRQIKVLYFQGKFTKSIQACLEVIKADPKNSTARKFYLKNQKAIAISNHKMAYQSLKEYNLQLSQLSPEQREADYTKV